jgi:hypothetical protein
VDIAEILTAFTALPQVRVTAATTWLAVHIPALNDSAVLVAAAVQELRQATTPDGSASLEMVVADQGSARPLIVLDDDIVFAPEDTSAVLDGAVRYVVEGMPPLVAYSEMMRDLEHLGRTDWGADVDGVAGMLLLTRCFLSGAARFGLRPVAGVYWWLRAWDGIGRDAPLPPWRDDPVWTALAEDAGRVAPDPGPE